MIKKTFKNILNGLLIVIISFLILLAMILGYLAGSLIAISYETPDIDIKAVVEGLQENSTIVDKDGNLMEKLETEQFREIVDYKDIPENLVNAFVSAEDKRFWDHNGVDFMGVLASIRDYIKTGDMRGASTITMQLTRNVFLSPDVNIRRKLHEIFLSFQMEKKLSKEEIMAAYLNRIFFGQNAYGVQAASQIYFSKNVDELDLAQCATLAGVVQAPSAYALYSTYKPSQVTDERVLGETTINGEKYLAIYNPLPYERKEYVLERMLEEEKISQKEYDQAMREDVAATIKPPIKRADNISTFLTDLVKDQAVYLLMDHLNLSREEAVNKLYYGGLTIYTTFDMEMQRGLERKFTQFNEILNGDTTGWDGPMNLDLNYDEYGNIVNDNYILQYYSKWNLLTEDGDLYLPPSQYTLKDDGSLVLHKGRVRGYEDFIDLPDYYTVDEQGLLRTHRLSSIPIDPQYLSLNDEGDMHISKEFFDKGKDFYKILDDDSLVLSKDYYEIDTEGVLQPQAAATVVDTKTGEVRAIVGGREQDSRHFLNRASAFPRSPGSSFKPLAVYAGVFANGYNQGSIQDDVPKMRLDNGELWPYNVELTFDGVKSVLHAIMESTNTIAVSWLDTIGMKSSKSILTGLGIINKDHPERDNFVEATEDPRVNDENRSMALGALTYGMTTLDMASAFQTFGNNGEHLPALSISKITNNRGEVYFENKYKTTKVLKPQINYQLLDALDKTAHESFFAEYLDDRGIGLAAKTGTTDNNADFWFCGTTPYYTTALWLGSDNNSLHLSGYSSTAASFYDSLADVILKDKEEVDFEEPEGIFRMDICMYSGKRASRACYSDPRGNGVRTVVVSEETAPTEYCDIHVWRTVDKRNNLLAREGTPDALKATRLFINRPFDYDPGEFNGTYPADWKYRTPTIYSDLPINLDPVTTKNPDGSTTTEQYHSDGSKVTVVTYPDGKKVTTVVDPDGKVTTTEEEAPKKPKDKPENKEKE